MKKTIITIFLILILFFLYGKYINTTGLKINNYQLNKTNLPNNYTKLKIIQFSDLLIDKNNIQNLENLVKKINKEEPDIIIFTGDLIKKDYKITEKEKKYLIKNLNNIKCNLYKYSILGDNDKKNIDTYEKIMNKSNFQILNNEYTYLFYKEKQPIKIIGLTDKKKYTKVLNNEPNINPVYTILLTHKPDIIDNLDTKNIDLILAGHSLNGQIRLPFIGGLIKKDGAKKYIDSHYKINKTEMYISNGIGTENFNFRTFNKPSINEFIFSN